MKQLLLLTLTIAALSAQAQQVIHDQVDLQPGYTSQIYYKLADQTQVAKPSTSWDLGFMTSLMGASVISNVQTVVVYKVPDADSNSYATLDPTDYLNWPMVFNSESTWYTGALNIGADAANPFDFGWGIYDFNTHEVYGDSLFVIEKGSDLYKFWIRKKTATGDYIIRYKNFASGSDIDVTIPAASYATKNFVYIALENPVTQDFEPVTTDWDILFTNYIIYIPYYGPYAVTGTLTNLGVTSSEAWGIDTGDVNVWDYPPVSTNISEIGYDWKTFDYVNFVYHIEDSLTYFIKGLNGEVFSLVFTDFDFTTGVISFDLRTVSLVGINDVEATITGATVYPNPAAENLTLVYDAAESKSTTARLIDMNGKEVVSTSFKTQTGLNTQQIALPPLSSGVYQLMLQTGSQVMNLKVIVAQ